MRKILLAVFIMLLIPILNSCEKNDNNVTHTVMDYDGYIYKTVQIGDQIWMAENLKTTRYANGAVIQLVENGMDWDAQGYNDKAMCYFDNSLTNKDTYGALYTWAAAMNGAADSEANPSGVQGVCPDGWHLPSDDEWKELEMHLGMSQTDVDLFSWRGTNEGSKLAGDSSLWINGILEENIDFSSSDFMALPAGYRTSYYEGLFSQLGDIASFWSTTESGDTLVMTRLVHFAFTPIHRFTISKKSGNSVRCIKD